MVLGRLVRHTVRIANVLPGLAGAAMASWGASMIYEPAGWITGGIALLIFAREINGVPKAPKPVPRHGPS